MIKQVIILRKDLNMRKGKMIAQGAHASMKVFFDKMENTDPPIGTDPPGLKEIQLNPEELEWMEGKFTKIAVSVDSEEALLDVHKKAQEAGIVCSLITDAGLTEFDGVPTKTAVAIGPADAAKIDLITGELKLL